VGGNNGPGLLLPCCGKPIQSGSCEIDVMHDSSKKPTRKINRIVALVIDEFGNVKPGCVCGYEISHVLRVMLVEIDKP
jgi:hypothetical protein